MRLPYILTFCVIFCVTTTFTLEQRERNLIRRILKTKEASETTDVSCANEDDCRREVHKRGWATVIKLIKYTGTFAKVTLKVGHHTLLTGSLAMTIIQSATEGCTFYPDICENKDKLKKLEDECTDLASQLMTKYENVSLDYEMLRDITLNNINIDNIIQGIADEVNSVFNMSEEVDNILSAYIANTDLLGTYTAEEIVNLLVPPVENRLSNLEKMIKATSKAGYEEVALHIAIGLGVEAIISGFHKYYTVYQSDEIAKAGASVFSKTKLTFSALGSKALNFFRNFGTNMKSMLRNSLTSLRTKIANPKGAVKSYVSGISVAHTFINFMGAAAGAVMIYMNDKHWKEVSHAVKDALQDYQTYKNDLLAELELANNQTETVADVKADAIETFNGILTSFSDGLNSSIYDGTELYENLQIDILPEDIVSLINQKQADNSDVLAKQENALTMVQDVKFDLGNYKGWITALNMIVTAAYEGTMSDTPVFDILTSVSLGFQYQTDTVKQFSSLVSLESLICVLTFLLPSSESYGTFPLTSIRSTCVEGNPDSLPDSYILEHKDLTIDVVTKDDVETQIAAQSDTSGDKCAYGWYPPQCSGSVYTTLTAIEQAFASDETLVNYSVPTIQEVIYKIAELFPSLSEFAFIDLSRFRDGSVLSDADFQNIMWDAEDLQYDCESQARREARSECRAGK